ncbi:MAG: phosphotransferase family protein [Gemmataceae bacterium]
MSEASEFKRFQPMVRAIIRHHFGTSPKKIAAIGGGLTNAVFRVEHPEGPFIIRLSDEPTKINAFIKEQWATEHARKVGVPTHEILEVGNEVVGIPYMVVRESLGTEATHHPDRLKTLHEMGKVLAKIHTIRTHGFGETFDWSNNSLSLNETWRDFLRNEIKVAERLETLKRHRMLAPRQIASIRRTLKETESWDKPPALNHGDMRLKNVLADADGKIITILDWENCLSAVAPYWDLSVALHDLSIDAKEELLAGYGMTGRQYRHIAAEVKAINVINYAPHIELMAKAKDKAGIERLRMRLSGAMDLYSV